MYILAALKDRRTLVHRLSDNPTPVKIIVSEYPDYLYYTEACKIGNRGSDYTSTIEHTTLGMEICMAKIYLKRTGVLHKPKRRTDNK